MMQYKGWPENRRHFEKIGVPFSFVGGVTMKYTQIQREEYEPIITIGEYILETAPEVFMQLYTPVAMQLWAQRAITTIRDVTEKVLAAANLSFKDMHYAHVMTERLLPGHGGLLPGEREEVLYD